MPGEPATQSEESEQRKSDVRDELRTIAFRLREMHRLLSMRVQQENRHLEANGLNPITEAMFFKQPERPREVSQQTIARLVETLSELDLGERVSLTLIDGTTIRGEAGPIDYTPTDRLRIELRPEDDSTVRYELKAVNENGVWKPIRVRKYETGNDEWVSLGQVLTVAST